MSRAIVDLAASINAEHAAVVEAARAATPHARRCGELLLDAKAQCAHGDWLHWLANHCPDISDRTAQAYMRVARACLTGPERAEHLEALTFRGALAALAAPKSATVADLPAPRADVPPLDADPFDAALDAAMARLAGLADAQHRRFNELMQRVRNPRDGAEFRTDLAEIFAIAQDGSLLDSMGEILGQRFAHHARAGLVRRGFVTAVYSLRATTPMCLLVESRKSPGFWYQLTETDVTTRPAAAGVWPRILREQHPGRRRWLHSPDDGSLMAAIEAQP